MDDQLGFNAHPYSWIIQLHLTSRPGITKNIGHMHAALLEVWLTTQSKEKIPH